MACEWVLNVRSTTPGASSSKPTVIYPLMISRSMGALRHSTREQHNR
jgi:hypothetical protein